MARFQFNLGQLLVLTTVAAIFMGLVVWLDLPGVLSPVIVICYFAWVGAWVVIRGPAVLRGWSELRGRRARLRERQRNLELEIKARRLAREAPATTTADVAAPPRPSDRQ
jgi:hypothetical protein